MGNVLSQYRKQKPAPKKRPSNTLSDFLTQALQGYWDRQGKLAQEGLTMADQGARQMREGDPTGALGMVGGPLSYLMSPVSALVPTGEEIDTARDLPEWSKPLARAASHTALLALPGPDLGPVASSVGNTARRIGDDAAIAFGAEVPEGVTVYGAGPVLRKPGLGRGLESLMGDATDAERAALASRLGAESANAGGPVRYKLYVQGKEYTPPAHGTGDIDQSWAAHIAGDPNPLQSIQGRIAQAETPEERAMWQRIGRKFQTGEFAVLGPDGTPAVGSPRMMPLPQGGYQNAAPSAPPPKSTLRDLMRAGDEPVDVSGYVPDPASRLRVKMPGDDARYDVPSMEEILANQKKDRALLKSLAPQAGGGAGQTPGPAEGIIAYHGSPHTFDKFDMSKIGTGEGAQAYGHGLYFAEKEGVAKSYQEALSNKSPSHSAISAKDYVSYEGSPEAAIERLRWMRGQDYPKQAKAQIEQAIKDIESGAYLKAGNPGSMYQVRINAKPDEFLDWDRPLSEQPANVREALKSAGLPVKGHWTGEGAHNIAMDRFAKATETTNRPGRPGASEALKAAGIKGIRYKDAGSRSGEGGTYNYVVFDDKIIDILKRYGIPMTVGVGGGVVVTGANMPPDIAAQMGPQG